MNILRDRRRGFDSDQVSGHETTTNVTNKTLLFRPQLLNVHQYE